jgi:hypothetical protein
MILVEISFFAASALCGAMLGTWLGLQKLQQRGLLITLAIVMTMAGFKLLLTA